MKDLVLKRMTDLRSHTRITVDHAYIQGWCDYYTLRSRPVPLALQELEMKLKRRGRAP